MARLHEYQGKELLKQYNIPVPRGGLARTPQQAHRIAEEIGGTVVSIDPLAEDCTANMRAVSGTLGRYMTP